jgi:hypothetical protein
LEHVHEGSSVCAISVDSDVSAAGAAIGLAAAVALAVGGSLAATQAQAASTKAATAGGDGLSLSRQFFGKTVEPYTGQTVQSTTIFAFAS